MEVNALYSQMAPNEQRKAFERYDDSYRKCVVATNIAETSVTIPNIAFVVDCGYSKQKIYHPQKAVEVSYMFFYHTCSQNVVFSVIYVGFGWASHK